MEVDGSAHAEEVEEQGPHHGDDAQAQHDGGVDPEVEVVLGVEVLKFLLGSVRREAWRQGKQCGVGREAWG